VRCLISADAAAGFYDQQGFSVLVNQNAEHIVTDGAKEIISNAIRFS
jgi:metal-dependent hydrolase (beta-lactamase superfamily II)